MIYFLALALRVGKRAVGFSFETTPVCRFPSLAALILSLAVASAQAASVTWGVNGAGGNGNWDTSTPNWFDGSQNVLWPSNGAAVFDGPGGIVNVAASPAPAVSSIAFKTAGYLLQGGSLAFGSGGLTITTDADATIDSKIGSGTAGQTLTKNGSARLSVSALSVALVNVTEGELLITGLPGFGSPHFT
jgi:fibronectin-binding autotransporter adhesin